MTEIYVSNSQRMNKVFLKRKISLSDFIIETNFYTMYIHFLTNVNNTLNKFLILIEEHFFFIKSLQRMLIIIHFAKFSEDRIKNIPGPHRTVI